MTDQNIQQIKNDNVYSHIYNEGVDNRNLFNDSKDYEVFLSYLKDYLTVPPNPDQVKKSFSVNGRIFQGVPHQPKNYFNSVELIAYSLMPNHFHLLVRQITNGSLEKLIRSLSTRYAIYYNKKYQHRGSLFSGPYKSIQIKEASQLIHLSRYFHRESFEKNGINNVINQNYSSYEEYLNIRENSWVNPKVVLSYFEEAENVYFKGIKGYKNFVEKYELNQNENSLLERIIIDSKPEVLERRNLKPIENESFKADHSEPISEAKPILKPRQKYPEFIVTSILVFLLLSAYGFRNVRTSATRTNNPIISDTSNITPSPTPQASDQVSEQVSGIEDVQTEEPKIMLIVTIGDGSVRVNIRKEPSTEAEIMIKATNGDTFEYVSKEPGWYQIKLDDGSTAFISENYAKLEGEVIN